MLSGTHEEIFDRLYWQFMNNVQEIFPLIRHAVGQLA